MDLFPNSSAELNRKLFLALLGIAVMLGIGTVGFRYIEGLTWWDSIYFTTATVTTVGYGDIIPKTDTGRKFTTFFVMFGVGTVLYALSILAQTFIQSGIVSALGIRRKTKEMKKLSDHYIICGAGRVGKRIVHSLSRQNIPFVVIEINREKIDTIKNRENLFILEGDATIETNLRDAGVTRAKGLVTCLSDDAKNVYVALTARDINKNLHIVSRAIEEQAEPKLIRAGANRVVSPIIIGSESMTRALIKPAIADFMDSIVAENLDLVFEEIPIAEDSVYAGREIKSTNIGKELNLLIVAIRRAEGEMIFNPSGESTIEDGDLLIVIGKAESVQKMIQVNR